MDLLAKIKENLNSQGEFECARALALADELEIDPSCFAPLLEEHKIKVRKCELGQFGKALYGVGDFATFRALASFADSKGRLTCKEALGVSSDRKRLRSALKTYNLEIKYCQLGCFKKKKGKKYTLKVKSWVEDKDGAMLFGKGRTELLELIDKTGSISKAAKDFGMSYKKAWVYLHTLQDLLGDDLFIIKQGRGASAGTKLTPKTHELLYNFKLLQNDIDEYANKRFKELFLKDVKNEN